MLLIQVSVPLTGVLLDRTGSWAAVFAVAAAHYAVRLCRSRFFQFQKQLGLGFDKTGQQLCFELTIQPNHLLGVGVQVGAVAWVRWSGGEVLDEDVTLA